METIVNNLVRIRGISYALEGDVSYQQEKYFNLYYRVEGRVEGISEVDRVDCGFAEYAVMKEVVGVGEEILLRWYAVEAAYSDGADVDGYYYVNYEDVVAVKREKWIPVNDNIFVESDDVAVSRSGRVVAVANDVDYYVGYDGERFSPTDVSVGDYVSARANDMREVEHLMLQKMKKKLFVVQSKDLLTITDKEVQHELY